MLDHFVRELAAAFGCGVQHDDDIKHQYVAEKEEKRKRVGIQTGNDLAFKNTVVPPTPQNASDQWWNCPTLGPGVLYAPPGHDEIIAKNIHPKVGKDVQYVHPRHGRSSSSSGEGFSRCGSAPRASSEERDDGVMPRVASSSSNMSRTSATESDASINNGRRTPERPPVDASLPLRNSLNRNSGMSGRDSRNSLNSKRLSGGSIGRTSSDPSPERPGGRHSVVGRRKPMKVSISPERSGQPSNKGVPVEQD